LVMIWSSGSPASLYSARPSSHGRFHELAREWGVGAICLSPNGTRIAYGCDQDICIRRRDGALRRVVARPASDDQFGVFSNSIDWAPDGRRLVFSSRRGVWTMNVGGGHRRLIVPRTDATNRAVALPAQAYDPGVHDDRDATPRLARRRGRSERGAFVLLILFRRRLRTGVANVGRVGVERSNSYRRSSCSTLCACPEVEGAGNCRGNSPSTAQAVGSERWSRTGGARRRRALALDHRSTRGTLRTQRTANACPPAPHCTG
jgi:WD40-like Beta Propeller Repeat